MTEVWMEGLFASAIGNAPGQMLAATEVRTAALPAKRCEAPFRVPNGSLFEMSAARARPQAGAAGRVGRQALLMAKTTHPPPLLAATATIQSAAARKVLFRLRSA